MVWLSCSSCQKPEYDALPALITYEIAEENGRVSFMRNTRTSSCGHTARRIGNIGEMPNVGDCLIQTG
jgi:hypothetical protein